MSATRVVARNVLRARRSEWKAKARRHTSTVTRERLLIATRLVQREYRESFLAFAQAPTKLSWRAAERARRERDFVDRLARQLIMQGQADFPRVVRHQALLAVLPEAEVGRGVLRVRLRRA